MAPILLSLQIGFACMLMLAFTALWYGYLNPFTLFVASIIMGMGIDYSIHFMGNCQIQQSRSGDLKDALKKTIEHLFRPMFLAALTTASGLLTLLFAHFTGFYEFGVIAAVGITLSVTSALFALPVFILTLNGLPPSPDRRIIPDSWTNADIGRIINRLAIAALVISVPLIFMSQFTEFEHDFQKLRRPKRENVTRISTGVAQGGKRTTSTPAVVMGDDPAQLDQLYDTLMVRLHEEKDPYLRSFLTLKTFVPSQEDQEERLELIEEIRDLAEARVFDRATGSDSLNIALLRKFTAIDSTFSVEDLPAWSVDMLREKDDTYGNIGFIYGKFRGGDAREIAKFQDRYSHWNFGGQDLRVFSSQFIISDVVKVVKKDSLTMAVLIISVILLILILSLRKPRLVLISGASLLMGVIWTVSFMGLFTLAFDVCKLGIYNIIVIPTVIGVGIDATIYMLIAWIDTYRHRGGLKALYNNMGKMVMASTTTTMAGFGGVLFISHRGMRTIGEIAVLGLFLFLCSSQIFIPWLAQKLFQPTNQDEG
ncbi:MAG: MMPL family transporter [Fibrobacter sp.]|nr:MMPL family transporter [Fibrobacter sp.]